MASLTNYAENLITDARYRGQALVWPTVIALAFILATRGYSSNIRSAVVAVNDTVIPTAANGRLYKCTTGGTAGAGEPTWPITAGGTVTDESSAMEAQGLLPLLVTGSAQNFKVTYSEDFALAEAILQSRMKTQNDR